MIKNILFLGGSMDGKRKDIADTLFNGCIVPVIKSQIQKPDDSALPDVIASEERYVGVRVQFQGIPAPVGVMVHDREIDDVNFLLARYITRGV